MDVLTHRPLAGGAARPLGGSGQTPFAQDDDTPIQVSSGIDQRSLALHHSSAGPVPERLDLCCGYTHFRSTFPLKSLTRRV